MARAPDNEDGSAVADIYDDVFDDGEDLMARAASMMEFDDDDEDSGSSGDEEDDDDDSARGSGDAEEVVESSSKRQKLANGYKSSAQVVNEVPEDDEQEIQSVLQLKIDALLASVRCPGPSSSKAKPLNDFIDAISNEVSQIAPRPFRPAADAVSSLKQPLPFSEAHTDLKAVNWQLAYQPPVKIEVVGSRAFNTAVKWKGKEAWNIDLALHMPRELFQEKDTKDNRYFYKRAYYLSVVREALCEGTACTAVSIGYLGGNRRKPILLVSPREDAELQSWSKLRCVVRIIPTFNWSDSPFDAGRINPLRSNLRNVKPSSSPIPDSNTPTPIYNSDLAAEGSILPTARYLQEISARSKSYHEAAMLLKIWALQRGLQKESGLSHCLYLLSILLAYVFEGKCKGIRSVPSGSSPWQATKAAFEVLARVEVHMPPMVSYTTLRHNKAPSLSDWQQIQRPVLTDPCGVCNLFSETSPASLGILRYEAMRALNLLRRSESSAFDALFLCNVDQPHLRFDQTARLQIPRSIVLTRDNPNHSSSLSATLYHLGSILARGLDTRAAGISIVLAADDVDETMRQKDISVLIGLYLDPAHIQRLVEYGPAADQKVEGQDFHRFWGSRAETRKFRDGRILESVVWDAEGPVQRSLIFTQVVRHLISHHFGLPADAVHFFGTAYDGLLAESSQFTKARYEADPLLSGFAPLLAAFDYMVKELKDLKNVPLQITNVLPLSEALRHTSIFVPGGLRLKALPGLSSSANYFSVHDCHVVFETSQKWPKDLEAIQKLKAAFLARISAELRQAVPGCQTHLNTNLTADAATTGTVLVVILPQGFAFRLVIHNDLERRILEEKLLHDEDDQGRARHQKALIEHYKRFSARASHHGAIASLQHRRTSYSQTVRITKRWLAAHLLASHIPVELVELICANVYMNAEEASEVPHSGVLGFSRVLHFLSNWNWREQPLLVPVYTAPSVHDVAIMPTFPDKQRNKAIAAFSKTRKEDPAINKSAWFVATEKDTLGRTWGEHQPTKLVAGRVQQLARATLDALTPLVLEGNPKITHLFKPDLDAYDFVLYIDPARVSTLHEAVLPSSKDLSKRPSSPQVIRPGFNAVQEYLRRVQAFSGDIALLFYDRHGGHAIGGVFHPTVADKDRAFRIAIDFPVHPLSTSTQENQKIVRLDRVGFVDQLVRMADGLVTHVSSPAHKHLQL